MATDYDLGKVVGDRGNDGNGTFGAVIESDGHLYLYVNEAVETPDLSINDSGHLIYALSDESKLDLGLVKGSSNNPAGAIMQYAGTNAPEGWLMCDGSAISRTTYSALFAAIGTTYGAGDGSTTFNLPNLANRVAVGVSDTHGLGTTGGNETHTMTADEMPSHNHSASTASAGAHDHAMNAGSRYLTYNYSTTGQGVTERAVAKASSGNYIAPVVNSSKTDWAGWDTVQRDGGHTHTVTVDNSGGGEAISLMQPYVALNYIISTGI